MKTIRMIKAFLLVLIVGGLYMVPAVMAEPIEIKTKGGVGSYLTDANGMALYIFKKDVAGKSNCGFAGGCIDRWPAFYVETSGTAPGVPTDAIGAIVRDDGSKQTTLRGMPLYYFVKDKAPGDTYGQGVNNVWFLATP